MLAVVKNPGEVRARTWFLHQPHRSESTALSTQPNTHRASPNSKVVQFRNRFHCSQINHAFVSKAAMPCDCTLHPCGLWRRLAKKENKHRWSPQHVQLLWPDWPWQSSQVQDQSICMVHIFAGGTNARVRTPRKWAPWCSFSRMAHKFAREIVRWSTFTRGGGGGGGGGGTYTLDSQGQRPQCRQCDDNKVWWLRCGVLVAELLERRCANPKAIGSVPIWANSFFLFWFSPPRGCLRFSLILTKFKAACGIQTCDTVPSLWHQGRMKTTAEDSRTNLCFVEQSRGGERRRCYTGREHGRC